MSLTFAEAWNELKGDIGELSPFRAQRCVQRAWRDVRDARNWSFQQAEGVLVAVDPVTAGTAQVTQYSASVTGDAAAKAAWDLITFSPSGVPITDRQFRLAGKPVYNIINYAPGPPGVLTLDRVYQEATETASYVVFRCYFTPPSTDFKAWISVRNPSAGYRFRRRNLYRSKEEVDRRDPYRSSSGLPFWVVSYAATAADVPIYELWPHPMFGQGYTVAYFRKGLDLAPTDTIPGVIPDELVMCRARFHAYSWAIANMGRFKELAEVNWYTLRSMEEKTYLALLQAAKVQDQRIFVTTVFESEDEPSMIGPVSASWLQSHDPWYA
jgi:hypothetical protein